MKVGSAEQLVEWSRGLQGERALRFALRAAEIDPDSIDARIRIGEALAGLRRFAAAKQVLVPLLEHPTHGTAAALAWAATLGSAIGYDYASPVLLEALLRDPGHPALAREAVRVVLNNGRHRVAFARGHRQDGRDPRIGESVLPALTAAIDAAPDDANLLRALGYALARERRYEDAAAAYRRTLDRDPADGWARGGLADALFSARDYRGAAEAFAAVAEAEPSEAYPRLRLGDCHALLDEWAEAIGAWDAALVLTPAAPELLEDTYGTFVGEAGCVASPWQVERRDVLLRLYALAHRLGWQDACAVARTRLGEPELAPPPLHELILSGCAVCARLPPEDPVAIVLQDEEEPGWWPRLTQQEATQSIEDPEIPEKWLRDYPKYQTEIFIQESNLHDVLASVPGHPKALELLRKFEAQQPLPRDGVRSDERGKRLYVAESDCVLHACSSAEQYLDRGCPELLSAQGSEAWEERALRYVREEVASGRFSREEELECHACGATNRVARPPLNSWLPMTCAACAAAGCATALQLPRRLQELLGFSNADAGVPVIFLIVPAAQRRAWAWDDAPSVTILPLEWVLLLRRGEFYPNAAVRWSRPQRPWWRLYHQLPL